ncbi:hypothetical protein A3715_03160 [Oleiphilus sp. HI0009]|nr:MULTISPECIES: hypothetical protein [unclassified Oleiphilus]KZX72612.1 hypothetical protein A3715_03160 [Oleiphilus sp. HI0009]MCH2158351.1 hypothetical protein [Oleiphilaceae bacterium]KZY65748.1 hypothetical protein A3738_08090 [Oleiphilus sp. HI0066]KZY71333.1 hypothetical protein A3739_05095 [Oleiphilus sp. HI0067]KZZ63443.1 hypothetical protein A3762_00175 [Oleiphilus sp. HI0125]
MQQVFKLSATLCSALLLSACDPAFQTTAQKCAEGQALDIAFPVPRADRYKVDANTDPNAYQLYLNTAINTMFADPMETLTAEESDALTEIKRLVNEFLNYEDDGSVVTSATNQLDFFEQLVLTEAAFDSIRQRVKQATIDDDDFCTFTNRNIRFIDSDDPELKEIGFGEVTIEYSPFTQLVRQSVIFDTSETLLDDIQTRDRAQYSGFFQVKGSDYDAVNYIKPEVRQAIVNHPDDDKEFARFSFDEATDTELSQLLIDYQNDYCDTDPTTVADENNVSSTTYDDCAVGIPTRVPSTVPEVAAECGASENNKFSDYSFDLNSTHTGLRRLRVEVDLRDMFKGEVRIYGSTYNEAIYASDGTTVIENPTDCEKQAVLDALALIDPDKTAAEGVRLTFVPDTNYDITYQTDADGQPVLDENGLQIIDSEPTPLYTYQGTASAIP